MSHRVRVANFCLQETPSFPDGAPQREEYETGADFRKDCEVYDKEWLRLYECGNPECKSWDCPQHSIPARTDEVTDRAMLKKLTRAISRNIPPGKLRVELETYITEHGVSGDQYWLLVNVFNNTVPAPPGEDYLTSLDP